MHDDAILKDAEHVFEGAHKPLLGKGEKRPMSTLIILSHGMISSKAAVESGVIADVSVQR